MPTTDFAPWNDLLHRYVDTRGRVDYAAWKRDDPHTISNWIAQLKLSPDLPNHAQLAVWINLYNAFTIAAILEKYPISSIQPKILGIPNWIAFFSFFFRPHHSICGQRYSLAQIENQILRKKDSRIHFAIVCASMGCPLLRNEAYCPDHVDQQLEKDAARFINNPDKVRYDSGILYCSKIFKWYRQDFLKVAPSIPDYIRAYLDCPIDAKTPIAYLDYDWSLNQRTSS